VKWNDIGDNEIAGLLKEAAETIESEELQVEKLNEKNFLTGDEE